MPPWRSGTGGDPSERQHGDLWIQRALAELRCQLGMDVAFIGEFREGRRIFRYVDAVLTQRAVRVGASDPLENTYCQRVVDGRLPEVIRDARALAEARTLPATEIIPVGAHLSVPIHREDGSVYGTFCCFSSHPDPSLTERDAGTLRILAKLLGEYLAREGRETTRRAEMRSRICRVIDHDLICTVFQPIVDLRKGVTSGFEALSRFPTDVASSPDECFRNAAEVGMTLELELAAIRAAGVAARALQGDTHLAINASLTTLMCPELVAELQVLPVPDVVVEMTEHDEVEDYSALGQIVERLRAAGMTVAVDDAGSGYSSLRHILELQPDVLKLDRSLVTGIADDPARQAMARALTAFARERGIRTVAEGIETACELATLKRIGVDHGQGYYLGRPAPAGDLRPVERARGVHRKPVVVRSAQAKSSHPIRTRARLRNSA